MASSYDIVITDIEMPRCGGRNCWRKFRCVSPQTFVIIITAYGSIETAIEALRKGAYDYVLKPIEFDDLIFRVRKLLEHRSLSLENTLLRKELNRQYDFHNIIGQSLAMKKVFQTIEKVAASEGTVLITGKSGPGRNLLRGRSISTASGRGSALPLSIAALLFETLVEANSSA